MNPGERLIVEPLLNVAGGLGVAGVVTVIITFLVACCGIDGALLFGVVPIALGVSDLILIVIQLIKSDRSYDAVVLAAAFGATLAIVGGVLELAAWRQWPILFKPA